MAFRRFTKYNPNPNLPIVVSDPEKLLRKERVVLESQASYYPIRKFVSSQEFSSEIPLFRMRSFSGIPKIITDLDNLSSCVSSPNIEVSQNIIQ